MIELDPNSVPREMIPETVMRLQQYQLALLLRLQVTGSPAAAPEHYLTAKEAAARLRRSTKWLYTHKDHLPFAAKIENGWVFSSSGIDEYITKSAKRKKRG